MGVPQIMATVLAAEAELHLQQGNVIAAESWAKNANLSSANFPVSLREPEYLAYIRLLLFQNRLHEARSLLSGLSRCAEEEKRYGSLITIRILQSLTMQALADEDEAMLYLEHALGLAEPEGYVRAFADNGTSLSGLLYLAVLRGISSSYARKLLTAFQDGQSGAIGHYRGSRVKPGMIEPLSEREIEVLQLIARGLSNRGVAERLVVSMPTVKSHTNNIYTKLGVGSRTQAVIRARELGVLPSL